MDMYVIGGAFCALVLGASIVLLIFFQRRKRKLAETEKLLETAKWGRLTLVDPTPELLAATLCGFRVPAVDDVTICQAMLDSIEEPYEFDRSQMGCEFRSRMETVEELSPEQPRVRLTLMPPVLNGRVWNSVSYERRSGKRFVDVKIQAVEGKTRSRFVYVRLSEDDYGDELYDWELFLEHLPELREQLPACPTLLARQARVRRPIEDFEIDLPINGSMQLTGTAK